jgi:hypothetical protein
LGVATGNQSSDESSYSSSSSSSSNDSESENELEFSSIENDSSNYISAVK